MDTSICIRRPSAGAIGRRLRRSLLVAAVLLAGSAHAQVCNYEVEPNDDPLTATPLAPTLWQSSNDAEPVCLAGTFGEGGQDLYRWELGQVEAQQVWAVELSSVRGQLTIFKLFRVDFAEGGGAVVGSEEVFAFSTPDGRPVTSSSFVLEPGTYFIGTSVSGGEGEYAARLMPVDRIDRSASRLEQGRRAGGEFSLHGAVDGELSFEWTIEASDDGQLWGVSLRNALGADVTLTLLDGASPLVELTPDPTAHRNGLALAAGTYTLRLAGASGALRLDFQRQGRVGAGVEVEPNDSAVAATALVPGTQLRGSFDGTDYYRFDLDAELAARPWELHVSGSGAFNMWLEDLERQTLLTRRDVTEYRGTLALPPGGYTLRIDGSEGSYAVDLRPGTAPAAGSEIEPNDELRLATPLAADEPMRGSLGPNDRDLFELSVTGVAQSYRLQALGPGVNRLRLLDSGGATAAEARGENRLRLDDLVLLPGSHLIEVTGGGGDYALRAIPLGPAPTDPDPASLPSSEQPLEAAAAGPAAATGEVFDTAPAPAPPPGRREREPNDDPSRAQRVMPDMVHVGRLGGTGDVDYYRFHLLGDQYARLELVPPAGDVSIPLHLTGVGWYEVPAAEQGAPLVIERLFRAGDHGLMIGMRSGEGPSGYYQLRLTLLDSALLPVDAEPNDDRALAGSLPTELSWSGRVGEVGDEDFFRLPVFAADTDMSVTIAADVDIEAALLSASATLSSARNEALEATLSASEPHFLRLRGEGAYTVTVSFSQAPDPNQLLAPRDSEALAVSLTPPPDEVAAFWHQGQLLASEITVVNRSGASQRIEFEIVASDARARLPDLQPLTLAAGESRSLAVDVAFPPELRDDQGIRVDIAVSGQAGSTSVGYSAAPLCEAAPVLPFEHHGVREALAGRFNALWEGLGGKIHGDSDRPARDLALIDGRISPATSGYLDSNHSATFELAGGRPLRLVAALINPLGSSSTGEQLKAFRLETSLDGVNFVTALEGELASAAVEQEFEFEAPVTARFARLVFVSSFDGRDAAFLGELKLLAEDYAAFGPIDLADPALGGHVAWSTPLLSNYGQGLLTAADDVYGAVDTLPGGSLAFAVGFQDGRAAQVQRLTWRDSPRSRDDRSSTADTVLVEASLAGPAGPWQPLAEWSLEGGPDGVAELQLEEPTWVRYLRLTASSLSGERYLWPPDQISVIERAPDASYRSAIGEWGTATSRGSYEALTTQSRSPSPLGASADPGETPQSALRLTAGVPFEDSVAIGEDVDWLVFNVPSGENHFAVTLAGDPAIGYTYRLLDAELAPVAFEVAEESGGLVLSGFAEPGDYYLHLEEPKRTVVFAWDNSGSVSPYEAIIYTSLASFALGVDGEREAVQLLAFSDPRPRWLLPLWSSDPEIVQLALAQYDRRDSSSNAESAMLDASRALAQREGTRAVLLITDAESNGYDLTSELWQSLDQARPRVFTFEVSSAGNATPQDLMQAWALVNGGSYQMAASVGDVDAGFTRAACILRRQKGYTVAVATRYQQPPGPGTLSVLRDAGGPAPAVEVIFDASGSMGRELPSGERRLDAARKALELLVNDVLPDDTQFALRAFGHIAPSSCETRLDVPLGPLDRARAAAAVRAIEPKLLSQTPLADSLAAVAGDLGRSEGPRTVILITDGVESCGGDPAAAVRTLQGGSPLELAIVSLGLEPDALRAFEQLAQAVGASYVDVGSFEELAASIQEALQPAFEVLDQAGQVVATGRVGGAGVELPMGLYTVRVLSSPTAVYPDVRVPGDASVSLSVLGP